MSLSHAMVLLLTHCIPILFFTYMATDVLLRNYKKTEHILLSLIALCYLLLFAEEFVRNLVSIEYSPFLSAIWLSSVGIVIPCLCFHFLLTFTQLHAKFSAIIYPWILYLPLGFVVFNLITGGQWISAQQFIEAGMWKLPIYTTGYYIALTSSLLTDLLFLVLLLIAKSKTNNKEQQSIYNQLIVGIIIAVLFHITFGYFNYYDLLPPYPYLYSGMIWCYFLRRTMRKYDFINLYDKRFEKLFNLNPDAIVLMNLKGQIKNANPKAIHFFSSIQLKADQFFDMLSDKVQQQLLAQKKFQNMESTILIGQKHYTLLLNADYTWFENEYHVLLIVRDITVQKQYQEEIQFLAYHDSLTELANRRYFNEKLEEALHIAKQRKETVALLLIDIDQLKWINDNYGHLAGDEALQKIAQLLQDAAGTKGKAARMGGDEFLLFIAHSPSTQEIKDIINRLQSEFAIYSARFSPASIGISIGVSYYPADGLEGQALIHSADNAMFEMKRKAII